MPRRKRSERGKGNLKDYASGLMQKPGRHVVCSLHGGARSVPITILLVSRILSLSHSGYLSLGAAWGHPQGGGRGIAGEKDPFGAPAPIVAGGGAALERL